MTKFLFFITSMLKQAINCINNYYPLVAGIIFVLPALYLKDLFLKNDVHYVAYSSMTMAAFIWFVGVTWSNAEKDERAVANMIYSITQTLFAVIFAILTKPNNEAYLFNGELHGTNFNLLIFPSIILWLFVTVYFGRYTQDNKPFTTSKGITKQPVSAINNLISDDDKKVTVIHEIGHLFGYLAVGLDNLPSHFHVKIHKEQTEGSLGYVTNVDLGKVNPLDFSYAKMLVFVASSVAEYYYFGRYFSGAMQDLSRWEELARNYLITVGDGYFVNVSNYKEAEHNAIKLYDLRQKQREQIRELIELNDNILYELKDKLLAQETLNLDEIKEVFKEVILPDDFPVYVKSEKLSG